MNTKKRIEALKAMDLLARSVDNEEYIESWLMCGVADGDIRDDTTDEELMCYVEEDKDFSEIIDCFMRVMKNAMKDGGIYIDRVVGGEIK